ncbi:hypothetical protein [Gemella sanguinis]|uniref:hypothetical protein n=1 Tax=Gemella sanguinis TaxID=84135 RepID=UPI0028D63DB6|nr:hypothetical protein [Gemella sanguinis]
MNKLQGILMLLLSSVLLVSCQANKNENKDQNKEQTTQNESNKQEDSKKKDENKKEEANKKDSDSSNKNSSSTDNKTTDTKVIGSEEYGYVKVPKDWVDFKDINGGNDIQSSDTSSYNVVTLNIFRPNQLGISEAEYASIDPKQVANSVYTKHKNSQMFEKMSGTKSKIGGYDAYVINTLTNTGKYFITYIFKADDGKIHYTSIEGDKDTVTKMIPLLEESWSLKK